MMDKLFFIQLIILFFMFIHPQSFSQSNLKEDYKDVVLLKNGGSYRGIRIIEIIEGKKVTIENINGDLIKIPYKKIYAITNEDNYEDVRKVFDTNRPPEQNTAFRGHKNITQFGYPTGFSNINGAHLQEKLYLGGGLGFGVSGLRLYTDLRWFMWTRGYTPFVFTDVGFSVGLKDKKMYFRLPNIGIGFGNRVALGRKIAFTIQFDILLFPDIDWKWKNYIGLSIGTIAW